MKKVFIIGAHRSGTSKLASYFSEVIGFSGAAEGHVFRLVTSLIDGWYEIERTIPKNAYEINSIGFDKIVDALVCTLGDLVSTHHNGRDFFDKTPGFKMIRAVPFIARTLPESTFIHMHRHGIANVNSNLRLWPTRHFEDACRMWARPIAAYTDIKEDLGDRLLSLDMNSLILNPWLMHAKIMKHLGLPNTWARDDIERYFESPSVSSTLPSKPALEKPLLSEQSWLDDEKMTFEAICGPWMKVLGYEY